MTPRLHDFTDAERAAIAAAIREGRFHRLPQTWLAAGVREDRLLMGGRILPGESESQKMTVAEWRAS